MSNSAFTVNGIGSGGSGTVTNIATTLPITGGPITGAGTIGLANTTVVPGAYTNANVTVDAQGRITNASSGTPTVGSIIQIVQTEITTQFTTASTNYVDVPGYNLTITPANINNKILIMCSFIAAKNKDGSGFFARLVRDATPINVGSQVGTQVIASTTCGSGYNSNDGTQAGMTYLDSPNTILAVTYKIQVVCGTGNLAAVGYVGYTSGTLAFYGAFPSTMIAMEIQI